MLPDRPAPRRSGPVGHRSLFVRAIFDDPTESVVADEHELRVKLTEHISKFAGIHGVTVEMR